MGCVCPCGPTVNRVPTVLGVSCVGQFGGWGNQTQKPLNFEFEFEFVREVRSLSSVILVCLDTKHALRVTKTSRGNKI